MQDGFENPKPTLRRLPLSSVPLGATFGATFNEAVVCMEGLGQLPRMVHAKLTPGRHQVEETVWVDKIHGDGEVAHGMCTAINRATGRTVMATMTRTRRVAIMIGSGIGGGKKVAEVEPNGIENYQVCVDFWHGC
jgi:hypothetical protein